ncbi:hypothetical protein GCM10007973_16700 [Polymorphobacter multimanifer]|nr:hypothetical protein GCM10007973_16700 [Polymorphobacter multimanifer]
MHGAQHRRVAQIRLMAFGGAVEFDLPVPEGGGVVRCYAAEQAAEQRIAIDARNAPPHKVAGAVDERRDLAIADGPQVERGHARRVDHAACSSQPRTAATSFSLYRAAVGRSAPTRMP